MRVLFSKCIAAISKPRCGSTSLRRMLDPLLDKSQGDFAVDVAGAIAPYHPHMTAPFLQEVLREHYPDAPRLEYFITIRHPVDMLYSYYKFFVPDENGRYNYEDYWLGRRGPDFEQWILSGRVGSNPHWLRLGPSWVSTKNLSPLSLEAHTVNQHGRNLANHIFRLEEPENLCEWLSEKSGSSITQLHVNKSDEAIAPKLGYEATEKIRNIMPTEARLYNL